MAEDSIFSKIKPLNPSETFEKGSQTSFKRESGSFNIDKVLSEVNDIKNEISQIKKMILENSASLSAQKLLDELRNEIITGIKKDLSDELNKKIEEISKSVSANISIKEDAEKLKNILSKFTTILENNFLSGESSLKTNEEILSNIDKKIDLFLNKKINIIISKLEGKFTDQLYKNDELIKNINDLINLYISKSDAEREKLKIEFEDLVEKLNILIGKNNDLIEEISKTELEPKYLQKLFEISNKLVQIYSEFKVILELKNDEK